MDWKSIYESRRCSLDEAAAQVKSGDRVILGSACGTPEDLIDALLKRAGDLRDVELVAFVSTGRSVYAQPQYAKAFRHNGFFVAPTTRKAVDEDRADFSASNFGTFPRLLSEGDLPCDVAMITVTPPDKVGNCSLGISVSYDFSAARAAKKVIAEVNPNMPFTLGYSSLHVSEIDHFVWTERPIVTAPRPELNDAERKIGGFCASLIRDGDCLQLGYGALPEAVLGFMGDKRDLGIHSEMISDGVMHLVEQGVITGARKNFRNRKIVITFAIGTREFYDWIHLNSMVEMHPVEYINDPAVIGLNDNMVSINSALSVDLLGQAAADMMGARQYSGVGGQVEFVRGCRASKGGRSIIALAAASSDGTISRIVPAMAQGQAVTTSRNDIDYVITDYGIAHLRGRTVKERARMLVEIAAPQFRDWLREEFQRIYGRDCTK
ncbi:MAG: acetyl-CoA hydrolase/transferase C-terminal domain-containing protein [Vicinamibacterales bacterium]